MFLVFRFERIHGSKMFQKRTSNFGARLLVLVFGKESIPPFLATKICGYPMAYNSNTLLVATTSLRHSPSCHGDFSAVPGKQGASGAGFLRMRPGGRLKPHFGNAPRDLDGGVVRWCHRGARLFLNIDGLCLFMLSHLVNYN